MSRPQNYYHSAEIHSIIVIERTAVEYASAIGLRWHGYWQKDKFILFSVCRFFTTVLYMALLCECMGLFILLSMIFNTVPQFMFHSLSPSSLFSPVLSLSLSILKSPFVSDDMFLTNACMQWYGDVNNKRIYDWDERVVERKREREIWVEIDLFHRNAHILHIARVVQQTQKNAHSFVAYNTNRVRNG